MSLNFYQPERSIIGPAYSPWFKILATLVCTALVVYSVRIFLGFPMMTYGFGVKLLLFGAGAMLVISYYWFLRSMVTIDDKGISQTWMYNRRVEWPDVRSAKLIGIPYLSGLFPPRLVVRTGTAFVTFNGGSRELLIEYAKISMAYRMQR